LALRLRQKFGKGLRVAYYRDIVRPRILQTRPVHETTDSTCEIHALTRSEDFLDLVWCLKSFYHFSERRYKLCVHDDGSLLPDQRAALRTHFPTARLVDRALADQKVLSLLAPYPISLEFRRRNILAPKVFDFVTYLEAERMLIIDSDVLF